MIMQDNGQNLKREREDMDTLSEWVMVDTNEISNN